MKSVVFEFVKIRFGKNQDYIFQYIHQRKLSPVCHSHDFYEIAWVLDGSCVQGINEVRYEMAGGAISLLRPGDAHVFFDQSEDLEMIGLSVRCEEFERVCSVFGKAAVTELWAENASPVTAPCELMLRQDRVLAIPYAEYGDEECKLLLLALVKALMDRRRQRSSVPSAMRHLLETMRERENLRRGLCAMVELSGYSQSHLFRLVKQYTGVNPNEYIKDLRLEAAYHDLISTRRRLEDIATDVGYESFSHFNRIFKQKYGITPAALRKGSGAWTT